jgi:AraC family transcriptional regulator, melibiose operon regulatory protein
MFPDSYERRDELKPYGLTCDAWEAVPMTRPDRHDEIVINFLDQGTLTYLMGGNRIAVEPQTSTVFWAGVVPEPVES